MLHKSQVRKAVLLLSLSSIVMSLAEGSPCEEGYAIFAGDSSLKFSANNAVIGQANLFGDEGVETAVVKTIWRSLPQQDQGTIFLQVVAVHEMQVVTVLVPFYDEVIDWATNTRADPSAGVVMEATVFLDGSSGLVIDISAESEGETQERFEGNLGITATLAGPTSEYYEIRFELGIWLYVEGFPLGTTSSATIKGFEVFVGDGFSGRAADFSDETVFYDFKDPLLDEIIPASGSLGLFSDVIVDDVERCRWSTNALIVGGVIGVITCGCMCVSCCWYLGCIRRGGVKQEVVLLIPEAGAVRVEKNVSGGSRTRKGSKHSRGSSGSGGKRTRKRSRSKSGHGGGDRDAPKPETHVAVPNQGAPVDAVSTGLDSDVSSVITRQRMS